MIPSFVRPTEAQKVLLIGKSINFLREVCHQPLSDFRMPESQPTQIINSDLHTIIAQRIDGNKYILYIIIYLYFIIKRRMSQHQLDYWKF